MEPMGRASGVLCFLMKAPLGFLKRFPMLSLSRGFRGPERLALSRMNYLEDHGT